MKLARASVKIFINRILIEDEKEVDDDTLKNGYMILGDFLRRCNYLASAEGLIISHIVRKAISNYVPSDIVSGIINVVLVIIEVAVNLLDDFVGFQLTVMGLKQHQDFFNAGSILGRLAKIGVAFYSQGWYDLLMKLEDYL